MSLTAVIIDDEPLARTDLEHELSGIRDVSIKDSCGNGVDGIQAIHAHAPDLIFLDIQMPGLNGFEMLSLIDPAKVPFVVFVTAYDEHAVRAFEENALDYILKPVRRERLVQSIERARKAQECGSPSPWTEPVVRLPCRVGRRIRLVAPDSVYAAYSNLTGVHLLTEEGVRDTDLTLRTLENRINLFRCHKQYVVALSAVEEITVLENGCAELQITGGAKVPVGRRYVRALKERLGIG